MANHPNKPTGITVDAENQCLYVVCEDGTVWTASLELSVSSQGLDIALMKKWRKLRLPVPPQ